jgi:hypothetical protein
MPQPEYPEPLSEVHLCAVIPTWCEGDVIASTVHNAFAQGCERVFLVDNDSPDDTVAQATSAGAEVGNIYRTDHFDLGRCLAEMRRVMEATSTGLNSDHVWWLTSDADEFPHGPGGLTIHEYLSTLDRRYRAVGARVFNHYPSGEPAHRAGEHPLDYQPMCQEVSVAWCALKHWKHPLVRWDRGGPPLWPGGGFHRLAPSKHRVIEPNPGIFLHHFQYRERAATLNRLELLCKPGPNGESRTALEGDSPTSHRLRAIEDVYAGNWDRVPVPSVFRPKEGVQLKPWDKAVSSADAAVRRWYLDESRDGGGSKDLW